MKLLASLTALSLLGGCSGLGDRIVGNAERAHTSPSAPVASGQPSAASEPSSPPPSPPPGEGAAFSEVLGWIEAAVPADPGSYHVVTQTYTSPEPGASTTQIPTGTGFAFSSPSGKLHCVSANRAGDLTSDTPLSCIAALKNPPPKPDEAPVRWHGNWVYYEGASVQIGAYQGGCSALRCAGDSHGAVLPYGQKISSVEGDPDQLVCRMDQTGLWCADKTKGSAILLNDQGVTPYGCLRQSAPAEGGVRYSC